MEASDRAWMTRPLRGLATIVDAGFVETFRIAGVRGPEVP